MRYLYSFALMMVASGCADTLMGPKFAHNYYGPDAACIHVENPGLGWHEQDAAGINSMDGTRGRAEETYCVTPGRHVFHAYATDGNTYGVIDATFEFEAGKQYFLRAFHRVVETPERPVRVFDLHLFESAGSSEIELTTFTTGRAIPNANTPIVLPAAKTR